MVRLPQDAVVLALAWPRAFPTFPLSAVVRALCALLLHSSRSPSAPSSSTPFCSSAASFPWRLHRTQSRDAFSSPQPPRSLCFQSHLRLCNRGSWICRRPGLRHVAQRGHHRSPCFRFNSSMPYLKHTITLTSNHADTISMRVCPSRRTGI